MKNLIPLIMSIALVCCGDPDTVEPVAETDTAEKVKDYFPVNEYLQSEIRFVDSLPIAITKYTTTENGVDSIVIKPEEFHQLAQAFISPVLSKENFEKEYKESSFFDNTTNYSSFLYSTPNKNLPIQRIDVVAKQDDVVYNKVRSIYMEKLSERGDSSFIEKLYWKAGENFQITTEVRTSSQDLITKQVKVVWKQWE